MSLENPKRIEHPVNSICVSALQTLPFVPLGGEVVFRKGNETVEIRLDPETTIEFITQRLPELTRSGYEIHNAVVVATLSDANSNGTGIVISPFSISCWIGNCTENQKIGVNKWFDELISKSNLGFNRSPFSKSNSV